MSSLNHANTAVDLEAAERHFGPPLALTGTTGDYERGLVLALIAELRASRTLIRELREAVRYAHARLDDCEHTPPHWEASQS